MIMHAEESKEQYIERLFASIAPRYDLLNSVLSLNLHKEWRKYAVNQCNLWPGDKALDVCAGTLDFAIELSRAVGASGSVTAVDFCRPMLEVGEKKLLKKGINNVSPIEGNAECLPLPSESFQAATIGFALRNVSSVEKTVSEMARAVCKGGRVVCLELALPQRGLFRSVYGLYLNRILPFIGGAVNGKREPYQYLPASVASFCSREELAGIMEKVGLAEIAIYDLTGGAATVHVGTKK